jgi:hypothetical protein
VTGGIENIWYESSTSPEVFLALPSRRFTPMTVCAKHGTTSAVGAFTMSQGIIAKNLAVVDTHFNCTARPRAAGFREARMEHFVGPDSMVMAGSNGLLIPLGGQTPTAQQRNVAAKE